MLTVPLANGGRKTYAGLQQAAPTYQRLNPFGDSATDVREVAPAEDFGRLGTMTIPPHRAVMTTVTFAIADPSRPTPPTARSRCGERPSAWLIRIAIKTRGCCSRYWSCHRTAVAATAWRLV